MKNREFWPLQLFAEGGEGAAEGSGTEAEGTGAAQVPEEAVQPEAGMLERIQQLEQQLSALQEQQKPAPREADPELVHRHWRGVNRIYDGLSRQAEQVKALFPEFDLRSQLGDARFARMLRAGVDMGTAYQVLHSGEILPAAMEYAARATEQRLASAMRAGLDRPMENGLHAGAAVRLGSEVASMSRQDYDRICRRVERGERVSFG